MCTEGQDNSQHDIQHSVLALWCHREQEAQQRDHMMCYVSKCMLCFMRHGS